MENLCLITVLLSVQSKNFKLIKFLLQYFSLINFKSWFVNHDLHLKLKKKKLSSTEFFFFFFLTGSAICFDSWNLSDTSASFIIKTIFLGFLARLRCDILLLVVSAFLWLRWLVPAPCNCLRNWIYIINSDAVTSIPYVISVFQLLDSCIINFLSSKCLIYMIYQICFSFKRQTGKGRLVHINLSSLAMVCFFCG